MMFVMEKGKDLFRGEETKIWGSKIEICDFEY